MIEFAILVFNFGLAAVSYAIAHYCLTHTGGATPVNDILVTFLSFYMMLSVLPNCCFFTWLLSQENNA
jgi:hypothetical protein